MVNQSKNIETSINAEIIPVKLYKNRLFIRIERGFFPDKNFCKFEVIFYSLLLCYFAYLIPLKVPNFTGTNSCEKRSYEAVFSNFC